MSFWKWRQVKESKMKNTLKCYEKWQHCRLINSVLIATKEVRPMLIWQSDHLSVHHAVGFCKCTENILHSSWQSCCLFIIYRLHCIHTNFIGSVKSVLVYFVLNLIFLLSGRCIYILHWYFFYYYWWQIVNFLLLLPIKCFLRRVEDHAVI